MNLETLTAQLRAENLVLKATYTKQRYCCHVSTTDGTSLAVAIAKNLEHAVTNALNLITLPQSV